LWSVCYARSLDSWRGQRRSIDFSNGPPKNQNDENECSTQGNDLPLGASASRPNTRGHPNTGRCRQTMYVTTFVISDNNACPQKTDPGHDALENMARIGSIDRMDG
jgi:hypothetical protein